MWTMFYATAKAWVGTFMAFVGPGLGEVIVSGAEKTFGSAFPATAHAAIVGIIAAPFVWLSIWATGNAKPAA